IHWSGQDDSTGAGLRAYTVYLKKDTGPFTAVASNVTTNIMDVMVEEGHQYSMYTMADDNANNAEAGKTQPDQHVIIVGLALPLTPQLPHVTALFQNAPNPWQSSTRI